MAEDTDKVELQRQINELRWELRDTRTNTINWWLAVNGLILTFFGIVVVIGGYVGFTRFQKLETETQNYVDEMKIRLDRDVQEIQQQAALGRSLTSEDAASPNKTEQVKEAVLEAQRNPTLSPLDLAVADALGLQREGKIDAAIEKWRSIANVAERIDTQLAARAWLSVGYLLQERRTEEEKTKNAHQALFAYDEAIRLQPEYVAAYNNRCNAKWALSQFDDAIADCDEAIRLKPDYATAYSNRCNAKWALSQFDDAIADCDEAIRLKPDYAKAYNNRCNAKWALSQFDDAIADCDEAIRLKPDLPQAYYNRGKAKQAQNRFDDAIADYDEAIRLKPDYPEAYSNRGNVKQAQNRFDDAIADYDEAIRLRPDNPEAYYNRGIGKIVSGLNTEGQKDLETALELARKANNTVIKSRAEQVLRELNPEDAP